MVKSTRLQEANQFRHTGFNGNGADPYIKPVLSFDLVGFEQAFRDHNFKDFFAAGMLMIKNFRQYQRLDQIAANVDHPFFNGFVIDPADCAIVFNANENAAAMTIGKCHHFLVQAFIMKLTTFEFGDLVFTLFEDAG